jgi:type II secretory pathway component GspD/PulD (secretin)/tetratricopeptide (TPR) repeat protein
MTKVVSASIGLIFIFAATVASPAQTNPADTAVNEAVMRQADTILLRQKLDDARDAVAHGDLTTAARLYDEAYSLVQKIGSGIDAETAQTIDGLASTRLQLARIARDRGDLREANTEVTRVLKVDPKNPAALEFKKQLDKLMAQMRGKMPDEATQAEIPAIMNQKVDANTLVRDGKLLYEAGKYEEAGVKLEQAIKLDPNNQGAIYYLNLVKQATYAREEQLHAVDSASRIVQVAKAWESPMRGQQLPVPNRYASTNLIHTGPGREAIVNKLNLIRLNSVFYDGLPLSEVVRNLSEQSKLRDPEKIGVNFLINPNQDNSPETVGTVTGTGGNPFNPNGIPQQPAATQIDPNTGLPITAGAASAAEQVDVNSVVIKINPALNDVTLGEALDAIVQVADHPIKYSIEDYAVVFSARGPQQPQLYSRTFRVDPNTFYQGLESVAALSFGSANNNNSGGGSSGGGGGGGSSQNGNSGAVVPVIVTAPGGASLLSTGNGSGGGGGGAGNNQNSGGLRFVTEITNTVDVSVTARNFFTTLGVDLSPPKSLFFNDRLGLLFVRATSQDLDTIENAIEALNQVAPQVHIKSRFIQIEQDDEAGLGFDWYLGQFNIGNGIGASAGNAGSVNVPTTAANPSGTFPGNPFNATTVPTTVQSLTSGLNNSSLPAIGTLTGILTDPNFQVVLHALQQRQGAEELAEPEVTTTSGRQTQMRATQIISIITGYNFNNGGQSSSATTSGTVVNSAGTAAVVPNQTTLETGPVLDVIPDVLADGYTINLTLIPSLTEFNGYQEEPSIPGVTVVGGSGAGVATVPAVLPAFTVRQVVTTVNVWDGQTVVLGGLISSQTTDEKDKVPVIGDIPLLGRLFQSSTKMSVKKNLMIFVTATIVDPAGNRVHSEDELPFAQNSIPPQPPGAGQATETDRSMTIPPQ